jgi:hypothetical protein
MFLQPPRTLAFSAVWLVSVSRSTTPSNSYAQNPPYSADIMVPRWMTMPLGPRLSSTCEPMPFALLASSILKGACDTGSRP